MENGSPQSFAKLNDELLEQKKDDGTPKRNSKDDLIHKIIKCAEANGVRLEHSNTRLRRMTKQQLIELLAKVMEDSVRNQMAEQVGAKPGCADSVIALGALKMIHGIAANTAEKGLNIFLPKYGYEVDGFAESLKQPAVDEAVTACLTEIAAESDVLQYIQSPYARLAIAWSGALVTSIKKSTRITNRRRYATGMEPRKAGPENPLQPRPGRGEKDGQKYQRVGVMPTHETKV